VSSPLARAAPLLFGSGLCALTYQVVWQRELRLVFGGSTAANAAVLAIFIGALGLGSALLGPRADRHPRPFRLYAALEALIAASAAATPLLLWVAREAYVRLGGTPQLGTPLGTLIRLLLSALVLAMPCFLMGGTLPAATRALESASDVRRRAAAAAYGINTLGAVAGALLATFLLMERLGTRRTLLLAVGLNLLVAALAAVIRLPRREEGDVTGPSLLPDALASRAVVLAAAALTGFVFFLMEMVWYRMLTPLLGGTVFTFGLILAVALLGIGLGGVAYAVRPGQRPPTLTGFGVSCLLEATALGFAYLLGDRLALLALDLRPGPEAALAAYLPGWLAVTGLAVLPAAAVAGFQFPLLIGMLGRGVNGVGRDVGIAYAFNTAGAIVGSLAGGFGLLPALSAPGCWKLATGLLALLGAAAGVRVALRLQRRAPLLLPVAAGMLIGAIFGAAGPSAVWRHGGIGAGRAPRNALESPLVTRAWLQEVRRALLWEADGVESSVALQARGAALSFVVNGKIDGNARGDIATFVMSGLLGAAFHPAPQQALVIGLGTGATAGWLGVVPGMKHVDVVELEPRVLDVAAACAAVNRDVLANPRVSVRLGDGREVLLVSGPRYDLIVSEPSNPYRAGVASLFTREFYEAAARRLAPDGVLVQWVQAYEVDRETLDSVYATLTDVFPEVETWQAGVGDLLLLARRQALRWDETRLRRRFETEPFRSALRHAWRSDGLEGVLARFAGTPEYARAVAARARGVNTDDHNRIEFGFARSVGRASLDAMRRVRQESRDLHTDRPEGLGGVDWARVAREAQLVVSGAVEGSALVVPGDEAAADPGPDERPQAQPEGLAEIALRAEPLAYQGRAEALPLLEQLATLQPVEAAAIRARLLFETGRLPDATAALLQAFAGMHTDPWASTGIVSRALGLAETLVQRDAIHARPFFDALESPFSVRAVDDARLQARLIAALRLGLAPTCLAALAPFEPDVPWRADVLVFRRSCYEAHGDPRVTRALEDLEQYLRDSSP
jgi:spermidine synthase